MKSYSVLLLAFLFLGCNITENKSTHCYQRAGDYLASGRTWDQPEGHVDEVFHSYQTPGWDLWFGRFDVDTVTDAFKQGHRVVIQYRTGPHTEHSEPLMDLAQLEGKDLTMVFVAYRVGPDEL